MLFFVKYLYIFVLKVLLKRSKMAPFNVGIVSGMKTNSPTFKVLLDSCIKKFSTFIWL